MKELSAAFWLKSRDLLPASRSPKMLIVVSTAYLAFTVLLTWGSFLLPNYQESALDSALLITSPLWLLWALIPFLGGGGGDIEAANRLAPYPVSPRVHLYSTWVSSFLDFPYILSFPALVATSFAVGGPLGLLLALCFLFGSSALGQLGAWTAGALHRRGRGESLTSMLVIIAGVGLLSLTPLSIQVAFGYLPPGWFINALENAEAGNVWAALGWGLLLALPVPVVIGIAPAIVTRAISIRAQGTSARPRAWGKTSRSLPPFWAMVQAMTRSTWRALATKALLLSVLAIPFLASLAFGSSMVSASSMVFFVAFASAATVSVNLWAFEGSGVQLWLGAPLSARSLLWARFLSAVLVLLAIEAAVLFVFAVLSGFTVPDLTQAVLYSLFAAVLCSAVGLRVSTLRPSSVDFDSLRARPTTFPAALIFMALTVGAGFLLALAAVLTSPLVAALLLGLMSTGLVEHLRPKLTDGAVLTSSLK